MCSFPSPGPNHLFPVTYSAIIRKKWAYNLRHFIPHFLGSIAFVSILTWGIIDECGREISISYSFCGAELRDGVWGSQDLFRVMSPVAQLLSDRLYHLALFVKIYFIFIFVYDCVH